MPSPCLALDVTVTVTVKNSLEKCEKPHVVNVNMWHLGSAKSRGLST